jgi:hypothetical protein
MIVAERFRADESGFAETGASHTKRLLVANVRLVQGNGAYRDRTGDLRLAKLALLKNRAVYDKG